jgi:hypothetical protein
VVRKFLQRYDVLYVVAVAAVWLSASSISAGPLSTEAKLPEPAKATLDYLTEAIKLVVSLNTALYGACAVVAIKGSEWSSRWTRLDGYSTVLSLVSGAVSYYGSYLTYAAMIEMSFAGIVDPFSRRLQWGLSLQYYGVLVGIFLIGAVFCRMLEARKANSEA